MIWEMMKLAFAVVAVVEKPFQPEKESIVCLRSLFLFIVYAAISINSISNSGSFRDIYRFLR